ncbi:MAG: S26 family signal peptidase [Alloprevotella sp.]|nr:S26 family signal peptidase [Alloprevotella sp.]
MHTPLSAWLKFGIATALYLAFLYWVGSWWGLLVVPFIFDLYITRRIRWTWWKDSESIATRTIMSWVDAIIFAGVAMYFFNQFFFQNYVIPSSSLEKSLLTGDYLLVSKLAYGPRIPQTPLYMPLTQHTLPVIGTKSYLDWPHWDYRRIKGLGHPQLGDIVVFNYPSGDVVALNAQNQDYYRMACEIGQQILLQQGDSSRLRPGQSYAEQQAIYQRIFTAGESYIRQNPQQFGDIVTRPADRRENYVKRLVGMPGQTLQLKNGIVYLDGKPMPQPEKVQQNYEVTLNYGLDEDFLKEHDISAEDLGNTDGAGHYLMPLTVATKRALLAQKGLVKSIRPAQPYGEWLYPLNMAKNWTTSDYGPLWIPKKGAKLRLTLDNLPIYERCIRNYEGNTLEVRGTDIFINGQKATDYTFRLDYYWMQGDNRDNSADSRFWGFVPEDHVVGKPLFIWLSLNPDYGLLDGSIRWQRLFNWVGNLK